MSDETRTAEKQSAREERGAFFDGMGEVSPFLAVAGRGRQTFIVNTADRRRGRGQFVARRHREIPRVRLAVEALRGFGLASHFADQTFVDVGAGFGTASVTALMEHGFRAAVACEPAPDSVGLLKATLVLNDIDQRVEVVQAALSDSEGSSGLQMSRRSNAHHLVELAGNERGLAKGRVVEVPVRTLDSLIADETIDASSVGLLWIDIPGSEAQILDGASALVSEGVPTVISFSPGDLREAGRLDPFQTLVGEHYDRVVDLRAELGDGSTPPPTTSLGDLVAELTAEKKHQRADVLLVPARK